jgi:adenine-specific DNA-methyltransferase
MTEQEFTKAGFTIIGSENNENKLLNFLKENYPNVIRDTELNLEELKSVLGLPIDEKVNGYGLNFVGRNFAKAKYAQKTDKELLFNQLMSKKVETTENLVLKGDNLDSLKILKNHYSGKIKCIYIDPPYNTTSDEFVYPDKFDKEEAEVLGLANMSDYDFARMDFSFKTKKSHNGWLSFMYPRLLLARDLLSSEGVIFISIDDNEQANLKLLCDEIFGEENFVDSICWKKKYGGGAKEKYLVSVHEYVLVYAKNLNELPEILVEFDLEKAHKFYKYKDENFEKLGYYRTHPLEAVKSFDLRTNLYFSVTAPDGTEVFPKRQWRWSKERFQEAIAKNEVIFTKNKDNEWVLSSKQYLNNENGEQRKTKAQSVLDDIYTQEGTKEILEIFGDAKIFSFPKPIKLIKKIIEIGGISNGDIVLDFFAGSGSTGEAIMQLNLEDGGNRKFILCQIDEAIKEDTPAYKFCIENNLPPIISSITIERLKRAGEKILKEIEKENGKSGMFEEDKKRIPDIGYKVFDSLEAPKLELQDGIILFPNIQNHALSRIYNMIFTIGLDEPTQVPEEVVKDCIYKIGNHYYITNSDKITSDDFTNAIKNGKVFIDGWTASLNGTLQNYKEDVKVVF